MRNGVKVTAEPRRILGKQREHWETTLSEYSNLYGIRPSYAARKARETFKRERVGKILELGAGQGRDSVFFAKSGFRVWAIEYTKSGVEATRKKSEKARMQGVAAGSSS